MFHDQTIEPHQVYFELISHYDRLFYNPDYGLAIVHQSTLVNVNPVLAELLGMPSRSGGLGRDISEYIDDVLHQSLFAMKASTVSPYLETDLNWRHADGSLKYLTTMLLHFRVKHSDYFLLLIPRSPGFAPALRTVAKQMLLMLRNDYRPVLIFDSEHVVDGSPLSVNQAAISYFDMGPEQSLVLNKRVHPKDQRALLSFAGSCTSHKSIRSRLAFKDGPPEPFSLVLQSYPIRCPEQSLVLSLVSDDLMHYVQDTKAQHNHQAIQNFFNYTKQAMVIVDKNMVIREMNIGFIHQFKYPEDELIGKDINNFLNHSILNNKILTADMVSQVEILDYYGTYSKMNVYDIPIYLEDEFIGKYLLFSDANTPKPADLKRLEQQLFNLTPEQVLLISADLKVKWTSGSFSASSEFPNDAILDQEIFAYIAKESQTKFQEALLHLSDGNSDWYGQLWFKTQHEKQKLRSVHMSRLMCKEPDSGYHVMTINHIQSDRELEQMMTHFAFQDPDLKVPNHVYSERLIAEWIYECGAHHKHFSVIQLAFAGTQTLNERIGPQASNDMLQSVVRTLTELLNPQTQITQSKDGGLLISYKGLKTKKDVLQMTHALMKELQYHLEHLGYSDLVQVNCGIATFPQDGKTCSELLLAAQASLLANQAAQGELSNYEQMLLSSPKKEGMIIRYLREGLHKGEFYIVYQPLIDLKTKKVIGIETLLRWRNESVGSMSPSDFIPLAEKSNLIVKIGYFVIGETVRKLHQLRQKGHNLSSSVNISLKQLEAVDFSEKIINIMTDYELPPEAIQFEITESITASSHPNVMDNIKALTSFGMTFNVDDFGTGYSSLKQMKHLQIKGLKIDHSLIQDMVDDPGNLSLVKAISAMAKNIGLKLIAEGVETKEQLETLEKIGFEEAQGFLFSVPLVDKDIEKFIEETNGRLKL